MSKAEKTKAFINRILSYTCRITSPDYDLYAMNAEIEAFCDKQILSKQTRYNLLLLVEELLQIYRPYLSRVALEMTIAYSEKNECLELICESAGEKVNPLVRENLVDDLGLMIIKNLSESIDYKWSDGKNRLQFVIKKTPLEG